MAEVWPGTLPQYVNTDDFKYSLSNSSVSSMMSTGYAKRRKKFTGQYATYDVSIIMTQAQVAIFEQFFNNNLGYGTEYITFPDPLFLYSTIDVRIKAGENSKPYQINVYGDNDQVVVSFSLERLISGYTPVAISSWPVTLPDCPLYNNYYTDTQSGLIRDDGYENGVVDVRRRFTAVSRYHNTTYILDRTQLVTFFDFYASLGYGSKNFTGPWPIDPLQTMRARFDAGNGFTVEYYNDVDTFSVSFILEELPPLLNWS